MDLDTAIKELQKLNYTVTLDNNLEEYRRRSRSSLSCNCATSSTAEDLDVALDSLGMLSRPVYKTSFDKRIENEKMMLKNLRKEKRIVKTSTSPLCVVQMNPDYIQDFSNYKKPTDSNSSDKFVDSDKYMQKIDNEEFIMKRTRGRREARVARCNPYPYFDKSKHSLGTVRFHSPEKSSPPAVSRQDSGNKSNPSSPVKSQSSLTSQGSSITRSRSLDDLEIVDSLSDYYQTLALKNDVDNIDTVSQSISQLHVS